MRDGVRQHDQVVICIEGLALNRLSHHTWIYFKTKKLNEVDIHFNKFIMLFYRDRKFLL